MIEDVNQVSEIKPLDGPPPIETPAADPAVEPGDPVEETPPTSETETTEESTEVAEKTESEKPNTDTAEKPNDPPDLSTQLSELSEGELKDLDDIKTLMSENKRLKSDLEQATTFKSEQAKKLVEFAKQYPGGDYESVKQWANVMSLDLEKLSDRDKLFESFALRDENTGISRLELRDAFEEIYDEKYGDESKISNYNLRVDLHKAEREIRDKQDKFGADMSAQPQANTEVPSQESNQELEQVTAEVDKALPELKTLTFEFGEDEKENFNFSLTDDQKGEAFRNALVDPAKAFQDWLVQFSKQDGSFDYNAYAAGMAKWLYADKISEGQIAHGVNLGKDRLLKELKNPSTPGGASSKTQEDKDPQLKMAEALVKARGY